MKGENTFALYGMHFDNDERGRTALWRLFRASVLHLSLHAFASNFEIYEKALLNENVNNATFAMSLAEDYALRAVMRTLWPALVVETAEANHQIHRCMKIPSRDVDLATRVAANLLSYTLAGKKVSSLGSDLSHQVSVVHSELVEYSQKFQRLYGLEFANDSEGAVDLKLGAANSVIKFFSDNNLSLNYIPTVPYTEHYSSQPGMRDAVFGDPSPSGSANNFAASTLENALAELSASATGQNLIDLDSAIRAEAAAVLASWEYSLIQKKRLTELYRKSEDTHFESFGFPSEDFAEFVRIRTRLMGRIRCAEDLLRVAKTSIDELTSQEYGFPDIPLAIQAVASKSGRNDVFVREETIAKKESWAILIDSSKSLEKIICTVRDAAVSLAEIANGMLQSYDSWACYTFNQDFDIIKDFSEPYSHNVRARIGGLGTGLKTYLPDAIRLAASRLQKTQSDFKVILVISDGYPQGYEGIEKDLLKAVEEVKRKGISLAGIGIESSAISKYFRTTCVAHDAYELMKDFVNSYYSLLAAAI